MRRLLRVLGLCILAAAPTGALAKVDYRLEVALGAVVPGGAVFHGVVGEYDFNQRTPAEDTRGNVLYDYHFNPGFTAALSLLVNDFELRYQFATLGWSQLEPTHVSFERYRGTAVVYPGELPARAIFLPYQKLPTPSLVVDSPNSPAFRLHSLTLGWRFNLVRGPYQPYIPVAIGLAIGEGGGLGQTLLGSSFQLGFGYEFHLNDRISLGFEVRYNWMLLQNPSSGSLLGDNTTLEGALLTTNASVAQGFVQSVHLVLLQFTTRFHFF